MSSAWAWENEPTPCCKIPREDCEPWPTLEIYKTLSLVHDQDLGSLDGQRQATLYLCIMLEMLLEFSLRELLHLYTDSNKLAIEEQITWLKDENSLYPYTDSDKLAEVILKRYHGRSRRISLYNKLSHQPLGKLLESKEGLKKFLEHWKFIADVRNDIIHGGSDHSDNLRKVIKLIQGQPFYSESILHVSLKAFIEVNNDIQQMRTDAA